MGISEKKEVIKKNVLKSRSIVNFKNDDHVFIYIILFVNKSKMNMFLLGSKWASPWFSVRSTRPPKKKVNRRYNDWVVFAILGRPSLYSNVTYETIIIWADVVCITVCIR